MRGAGSVLTLVLLAWTVGLVGTSAWCQTWGVVRRGFFRINAWIAVALAALALTALWSIDIESVSNGYGPAIGPLERVSVPQAAAVTRVLAGVLVVLIVVHLVVQYLRTDVPGAIAGLAALIAGCGVLVAAASLIDLWPDWLAALSLLAGAALTGTVTVGMLLGHWYLNQPGLKPWALARVTMAGIGATAASAILGLISYARLTSAVTPGAALGLPFGGSFGFVFYLTWLALVIFTGAVVVGARRCVAIRSIQSATGLYYVGLLTAGVAEFLVTYLMVNAR